MEQDDTRSARLHELISSEPYFGKQYQKLNKTNLNLGCGHSLLDYFINIDKEPGNKPDILCDLELGKIPFPDNSVDNIIGTHFLEHIWNILPLWREIYRVCKPKAKCLFIVPYYSSYDAMCNPCHYRVFDESYWYQLNPRVYLVKNSAGYADHGIYFDFKVNQIWLIPYKEFFNDPEIDFKRKHWNNVIQEIHALLEVQK